MVLDTVDTWRTWERKVLKHKTFKCPYTKMDVVDTWRRGEDFVDILEKNGKEET